MPSFSAFHRESQPTRVAIALGSNLGDRQASLQAGVDRLRSLLTSVTVSRFTETRPVGVADDQPDYLNGAVVGWTSDSCSELLAALRGVEQSRGRQRPFRGAARTLDLDLILHGDTVVSTEELTVPHPRFRERLFVLEPLAEIASDMVDPVTGETIAELLARATSRPGRVNPGTPT